MELRGRFDFVPPRSGIFQPRLTSPSEILPGVRVSLVGERVPALYLENGGTEPVTVLGGADEPFLRIGPDGTSANLRSPTWQRSGKAEVGERETAADADAAPVWQRTTASPRYAWIEPRAAAPDEAAAARERAVVGSWSVPLRRGTEVAVVRGVVEWIPAVRSPE